MRCLVRAPTPRVAGLDVAVGSVDDFDAARAALEGIDVAVYLVHSMGAGEDFAARDRRAAQVFAEAAAKAGVQRIVYLGGLGDDREALSPHLLSRHEVGALLAGTGVPVTELRAAVVVGAGSISFEMIRALVERLPVMTTPSWVRTPTQPVYVDDLLDALVTAIESSPAGTHIVEIGGDGVTSYGGLMRSYARARGLRRLLIPVPALTPTLSSLWLRLVTPLHYRTGRALIESIRHPTVVTRDDAPAAFQTARVGPDEAMRRALAEELERARHASWHDRIAARLGPRATVARRWHGWLVDSRAAFVRDEPAAAFARVEKLGGDAGWPFANALWRVRGRLDEWFGGPGLSPGRRARLVAGDPLDCWRIDAYEPGRLLRLEATMKLPGEGFLEFEAVPHEAGSLLRQTASFRPRGVTGSAYWLAFAPAHAWVFRGTLAALTR